jgi:quercetin dioxygenase-like cupin family protein
MARAREEIYNPVQGDSIIFKETARDTNGELMRGELVVSTRGGNPLHVHPLQEEHFEVLSGTLGVQIGEEHRSLRVGEEATVPPGTPHRWYNESDREEARVLGEVRPALKTETFFETLYGLARDGKTDENGIPNPLQFAVMLNGMHKGELYLAKPPIAVQKVLFALLSPIGKLLGYRDHYPKYDEAGDAGTEAAVPPSTTSVMARAVALAASLLVASLFLLGRMQRRVPSRLLEPLAIGQYEGRAMNRAVDLRALAAPSPRLLGTGFVELVLERG